MAGSLRERIEEMLIEEGCPSDKIGAIAGRMLALGRAKGVELKHQIGPNGFHRLIVNGEASEWGSPTDIIKNGDFVATTDAYINMLPQVGKVFSLRNEKDFVTESVQSLTK